MKSGMTSIRSLAVLLMVLGFAPEVFAQTTLSDQEKYLEPIKTSNNVTAYTFNSFGESTSLQDGSTSFGWTDIDIKGNNALPVRFQRKFAIENTFHGGGDRVSTLNEFGGDEHGDMPNLDIPYLKGTYSEDGWVVNAANPNARCTAGGAPPPAYSDGVFQPHDYWNGNWMHIPWVGEQEMLRNPATSIQKSGSAPLMTRNMWAFACLPTTKNGYPGEGFIAISPSGEKYYFDWVATSSTHFKKWYTNYGHGQATMNGSEVYFFVTRIEDRFGNYVTYSYDRNSNKLTGIDSSDGRYIHVTGRVNGAISTVDSSVGTWHYAVSNSMSTHQLVVTLPDQSQSVYFGTGILDLEAADDDPYYDPQPDCLPPSSPVAQYDFSVVLPSGAMADYQFEAQRHWTSNVPKMCNAYVDGQMHSVQFLTVPNFHDNFTLISKTVSGPALPTSRWTYSYPTNGVLDFGAFRDKCDSNPSACPSTSTTIVEGPDGGYKLYKFGQMFQVNSGQLLSVEEGYETGAAPNINRVPLRTTQSTYTSDAEAAAARFPSQVGDPSWSLVDTVGRSLLRPLKATSITQDGVAFTWQVPSTCNGDGTLCFDKRTNPLTVVKSSTLGYSRTEVTTYAAENTTKWVLGLVAQVKCTAPTTPLPAGCGSSGTVMSETTYDSTYGLPLVSKVFGKTQQTLTYNFTAGDQDGTLKTVKDGNNNVTTLGSWKRGIPQVITYPATPDQPTPVTLSASVNDSGWVTSVVDENGYPTGYGYDDLGRLASIVYPQEDNGAGGTYKKWNDTTIVYQSILTAEYGIPGGHWKRTESTGNSRKVTYYDALWRPLVEQQYDTADSANTASFTVKRYDASGRVAFQGYPQAGLTDYAAVAAGSTTTYDALDRVLKVSVPSGDSPTGTFVTTTAYLTGFKAQVTNPRTYKTITSYMAFDQPTTDWPVDIDQADGQAAEADTDIARDVFGKPTAITRHNPGNSLSETRGYVYDDGQRLCKTVEPETGATVMDYDGAGNVAWTAAGLTLTGLSSCDRTSVDTANQIVRGYDARNRLLSLTVSDGRGNQQWTYTPDGLPATITTANGFNGNIPVVNAYHYDHRRLLDGDGETVTEPNFFTWGIGYGWDANGHQSIQTYPSGLSVDFAPNAMGQPKQAGTFVSGVTYYPNGAIKHFVYGNGIAHDMSQNDRQLPKSSIDSYAATKFISDGYNYDANGNVAAISDAATGRVGSGDRTMVYDSLDRLTSTVSPMFGNGAAGTTSFSYDALDNLTKLVMPATATTPARTQYYCYDANTLRLASLRTAANCGGSPQVSMAYDMRGNITSKGNLNFDFDQANRLKSINNGGVVENYRYDGYGLRTLKNASSGNIWSQYTRDGRLLQEINARTAIQTEYIYLGGSLVANRETPTTGGATVVKYQHTDALGTPVAVTNASRTVIERSEYEPYGQLLNRPQHDGPGFTGHVQDVLTGLTYMQQRYYDPMIGRFLSVDPVTATSVGGNFNRYWYANNNPYRFVDPDGRCTGSMFSHTDGTCLGSGGFTTQSYVQSAGPIGNLETAGSGGSAQTARSDTPWVDSAATQLGQTEISGTSANQQIVNYLATTTFPSKSDETAWCSAFVNWSLSKAGIAGTNSASALSWSAWGEKLSRPAFGSVAIIDWGHGKGHVGFVVGITRTGRIALLGGNQADSVKISYFSPSLIKAYVYPAGLTPSFVLPTISGGDPAGFLNTR